MRRKKIVWNLNDVFAVSLMKGGYAIGHILDQRMVNTVRIALYSSLVEDFSGFDVSQLVENENLISLIEVTREQLDFDVWKIIGNIPTTIKRDKYANEQFRSNKWINSVVRDAALAEDFLNAYHGSLPWDDYYDPNYLDNFLINPLKKPTNLIYKAIV